MIRSILLSPHSARSRSSRRFRMALFSKRNSLALVWANHPQLPHPSHNERHATVPPSPSAAAPPPASAMCRGRSIHLALVTSGNATTTIMTHGRRPPPPPKEGGSPHRQLMLDQPLLVQQLLGGSCTFRGGARPASSLQRGRRRNETA